MKDRPPAERPVERRHFGRRTTCKPGQIILPDGESMACTVVDISKGGAAVQIAGEQTLPETFHLFVVPDDIIVLCRLIHRNDGKFGLQFLRSPRIASQSSKQSSLRSRVVAEALVAGESKRRNGR